MITVLGLLGKAVDLIVSTVAKKTIDLTLDEKKQAAKAFIRLHESLSELEQVASEFLAYIQLLKVENGSVLFSSRLEHMSARLKPTGTEFVKALREVTPVLGFYSPELMLLLGQVGMGKFGLLKNFFFLVQDANREELAKTEPLAAMVYGMADEEAHAVSQMLQLTLTPQGRTSSLDFSIPNQRLLDDEFGIMNLSSAPDLEGHQDTFKIDLFEVVKSNLDIIHIDGCDARKLVDLQARLEEQKKTLSDARESLRIFITEQFTVSDVLWVSK
jgi:hypothetical protein